MTKIHLFNWLKFAVFGFWLTSLNFISSFGQSNRNIITTIGQYTSNSASSCVGDTISLPVTISMANGIGVSAISFAINYDTTRLQCVSEPSNIHPAIASTFLSNCGFFTNLGPNNNQTGRQFRVAWYDLTPVSFSGVAFVLRFRILSSGQSPVTWDLATFGSCEYADVNADIIPNCSFINGFVTCGSTCSRPVATVNVNGPTTFCSGSNVVLQANTGSGLSYLWKRNNVLISGATSSAYTATISGSYSVIVRTSTNCASSQAAPVLVEVIERPAAQITANGPTALCSGQSVTLVANAGLNLNYQWMLNGTNIPGATNIALNAASPGQYSVNVSSNNGSANCERISNIINITSSSTPTALLNPSGAVAICGNQSLTLNAQTGNNYNYTWLLNGQPIQGATTSAYQPQIPGSYQVQVSSGTCSSLSAPAIVSLKPNIFIPSAMVCVNDTVEFPVVGSRFDSVAAISLALNYNPQAMTYAGYSNFHPLLEGLAQIGTTANQIRMAWASLNSLVSLTQDTLVRLKFVVQQPGAFQWNTATYGDCELAGPDGQILNYCFENSNVTLYDTVQILTGTQGPVDIWEGDSASLSVQALGATSFQWQYQTVGSAIWNNVSNGSQWAGALTYFLAINNAGYQRPSRKYRLVLSNGCSDWYSPEVLVRIKQRISIQIHNVTACSGDTVRIPIRITGGREINAISMSITLSGTTAQWLEWSPSVNIPNPGQWVANSTGNQILAVWNSLNSASIPNGELLGELVLIAQTNGSISWNTNNPGDCELADADGQIIPTQFVSGYLTSNPLPSDRISVGNAIFVSGYLTSKICLTGPGATTTLAADPTAGNQYQWYRNGQVLIGAQSSQYTASSPGDYSVFIATALGCSRWTQTHSIGYYCASNPTIAVHGNATACDTAVILSANTSCGPQQITWLKDGMVLSGISGSTYAATTTGTYSIKATDLSSGCVQSSAGILVTIHPLPVANATALSSPSICLGDSVQLEGTAVSGLQYQWLLNGNPITGQQARNLWVRNAGDYSLVTTNGFGCNNVSNAITVITRNCNEISGTVNYYNSANTPLPQSKVYLFRSNFGANGPWVLSDSTTSGLGGSYGFNQFPNGEYRIKAKPVFPWNGVNGTDALFILRHNTGLGFTLNGLYLEAADVTVNQLVNAGDVLTINRRFSSLLSSFPSGDWASENQDFTAIGQAITRNVRTLCYGDVNGSYNFSGNRTSSRLQIESRGITTMNNSTWRWPVSAVDRQQIGAISLVIGLPEGIRVKNVISKIPVGSMQYGSSGRECRIVWHALEGIQTEPDQMLFELEMEGQEFSPEALTPELLEVKELSELADLWANPIGHGRLSMPKVLTATQQQDEFSIVPNPSAGTCHIRLNLAPDSRQIHILVRDALGRAVYKASPEEALSGEKNFELPSVHWIEGAYSVQIMYNRNGQSFMLHKFLHRMK